MLSGLKRSLQTAIEARLDGDLIDRIEALKAPMKGRATDDFGLDPDQLKYVVPIMEFFYRQWFRVETFGLRAMPAGRVLFVSNHSGQIPIDGMMIGSALLFDGDPPRAVRSMVERWVPTLPFVSTFFARLGQVLGTPENCRRLLQQDHAVLVFPEGVRGISKTLDHAYQLQEFGHGFMRLALETRTPIVPVGVVGAEEQYPTLWNFEPLARVLGIPAVPIAPTMLLLGGLPLPVKYRLHFGRPMYFEGDPDDDELVVGAKVGQVKDAIAGLLDRGVRDRQHIFW